MKTFKAKIRIPTASFAYIELDIEGTQEQIFDAYNSFTQTYKSENGEGISSKEFNTAVDNYFLKGKMIAEVYESMSKEQKIFIQTCKRSFKRISRNNKETTMNPNEDTSTTEETTPTTEETPSETSTENNEATNPVTPAQETEKEETTE